MALGAGGVAAASTASTASTVPSMSTVSSGFTVHAGDLVLSRAAGTYTGELAVTVRNSGASPVADAVLGLHVPAGLRFTGLTGGGGCTGTSDVLCGLDAFAAGERRTITVSFGSYAGPARFARVTERGTVTVTGGGSTAASGYTGILKSSSGSVRHPRPYRPSTAYDLAMRAGGGPVVTRDASGVSVRLPLVAQDRTDAFNDGALVQVAIDGSDLTIFPSVDPPAPCVLSCPVPGPRDYLTAGEVRSFAVLFTLPADTAAGTYVARVHGDMNAGTGTAPADLTPQNNTVAFTLTVPAA
jgi:hypothetical protein